jgi:hypothetical protein
MVRLLGSMLAGQTMARIAVVLSWLAAVGTASADSVSNLAVYWISPNAREISFDYNYSSNYGNEAVVGVTVLDGDRALVGSGNNPAAIQRDGRTHRAANLVTYRGSQPAVSTKVRIHLYTAEGRIFFEKTFDYPISWWVPEAYPTLWKPEIKVYYPYEFDRTSWVYLYVRELLEAFNDQLYDATDGQIHLGKVLIFNRHYPLSPDGSGTIRYYTAEGWETEHDNVSGGVAEAHEIVLPKTPGYVHAYLPLLENMQGLMTSDGVKYGDTFVRWPAAG